MLKYEENLSEFVKNLGICYIEKYNNRGNLILKCKCSNCGKIFDRACKSFNKNNANLCKYCVKRTLENYNIFMVECKNKNLTHNIKIEEFKSSKFTVKCSCGRDWELTLRILKKQSSCPECREQTGVKSSKVFEQEFNLKSNEEYILLSPYIRATKKIKIKHLICGHEYLVTPDKFINANRRCPKCYGKNPHSIDIIIEKLKNNLEYEYVSGIYRNTKSKLIFKHKTCGNNFTSTYNEFFNAEHGCPICRNSKGEYKIFNYLKHNKINFNRQFSIENCKYKNTLKFDFAIMDVNSNLKFLLEYDGIGHFKAVQWNGITKEKAEKLFKEAMLRDEFKNNFCKENNIDLIRIKYLDYDNIESILNETLEILFPFT